MAALLHQPVVTPLFHDATVVEHDDPVGMADCHQPVRDRNGCACVEHRIETFLDLCFGERIDAGRGFVENHDLGTLDQESRQRDQLALPHGERAALLPHLGLQTVFQHIEPVASADSPGGLFDLGVGRFWARVADIAGHRARKEKWCLRHHADLPAETLQIERADVLAVEKNLAALELIEAGDQLAEGRLSGAGVPNQRDHLTRLDMQREVLQHWLAVDIGEVDISKLDIPGESDQLMVRDLNNARRSIDQGEDALRRRKPLLELTPERGDAGQRQPEERDDLQEEIPVTCADGAIDHHLAAEIENRHGAEGGNNEENREDTAVDEPLPQHDPIGLAVDVIELLVDLGLLAEVLGNCDATHGLLDRLVDIRHGALRTGGGGAGDPAEGERHQHDHRRDRERDQGQLPVSVEEERGHHRHEQDLTRQTERQGDDIGELLRIRCHPGDDSAGLLLVEERHVATHDCVEGIHPQAKNDMPNHPGRAGLTHVVEQPRKTACQQNGDEEPPDAWTEELARAVDLVDRVRDQHRQERIHGRVEHDHDHDDGHRAALGFEVVEDALDQSAIVVRAIVRFSVEPFHDETHAGTLPPVCGRTRSLAWIGRRECPGTIGSPLAVSQQSDRGQRCLNPTICPAGTSACVGHWAYNRFPSYLDDAAVRNSNPEIT